MGGLESPGLTPLSRDISFDCIGLPSPPMISPVGAFGGDDRPKGSPPDSELAEWNSVSSGICPGIQAEMG